MKRIFLFLVTNIAIMIVLGIISSFFGLHNYIGPNGIDLSMLLLYSAVIGFVGSFISLLISKPMAKWTTGAKVIVQPQNNTERWLLSSVKHLSTAAGIQMPEVAIYSGEPNAFATGAFKNSALVAVSTGLLEQMTQEEVEGVLAHEVSHIANGDMVTMTLIQGVMNTFVVFLSRVIGYIIDSALRKDEDTSEHGIGYMITTLVLDIIFGVLAAIVVAWFSRHREFRADAGATKLMGTKIPMINALERLKRLQSNDLPNGLTAFGIAGGGGLLKIFSTHPPLEERIAVLKSAT